MLFNFIGFLKNVCVINAGCNKSSNTDVDQRKVTQLHLPSLMPPPEVPPPITSLCTFLSTGINIHKDSAIKAPMLKEGPGGVQRRKGTTQALPLCSHRVRGRTVRGCRGRRATSLAVRPQPVGFATYTLFTTGLWSVERSESVDKQCSFC